MGEERSATESEQSDGGRERGRVGGLEGGGEGGERGKQKDRETTNSVSISAPPKTGAVMLLAFGKRTSSVSSPEGE